MPQSRQLAVGALVLLGVLLAACRDDMPDYPEAPSRIAPLTLRNAEPLLQDTIAVGAVAVQVGVPSGWVPLDSSAAGRAQQAAMGSAALSVEPVYVYGEQRTSSLLVVSTVRHEASASGQTVLDRILAAAPVHRIRVDTLQRPDGPQLVDVVAASQETVHHRIVLPVSRSGAVQFDYLTPRFQYPRTASLIEASAGSIRRLQ